MRRSWTDLCSQGRLLSPHLSFSRVILGATLQSGDYWDGWVGDLIPSLPHHLRWHLRLSKKPPSGSSHWKPFALVTGAATGNRQGRRDNSPGGAPHSFLWSFVTICFQASCLYLLSIGNTDLDTAALCLTSDRDLVIYLFLMKERQ